VHVYVVLITGAGDSALVEADVVTVRRVALLQATHGPLRQGHHLGDRARVEVLQRRDVPVGGDHQVSVGVGKGVEDHEAQLAAMDDEVLLVVVLCRLGAEDALFFFVLGGVLHVGQAPGRPDAVVGHRPGILRGRPKSFRKDLPVHLVLTG
jgi:hypothetical protein